MKAASGAASVRREQLTFFRQSGWMMVATIVSGAFMSLVHNPAGRMGAEQYGLFTTMVDTLILLGIPAGGVQGVFAQMSASAVTPERQAELRGAVRGVLRASLWVWLVLGLGLLVAQGALVRRWKADGPGILWLTLSVGLVSLWYPVFSGVLQGCQNFLWLGTASISSGLGRLVAVTVAVVGFGAAATGGMAGVLGGSVLALGVAAWAARGVFQGETAGRFDLRAWVGRLLPVTLGLAAGSVMLSYDTQFLRGALDEKNLGSLDLYAAAGRIGRALVMFTTPITLVLFPRVARSAATGESTGVLRLALVATLGTGILAALACTFLAELPLRVLYAGQPDFLKAAPLVPWFAWAMLPLTAAYALVNNLIARGRFSAVPWLVAVAAGYVGVLMAREETLRALPPMEAFRSVLVTLGGFSVLLLAVAVVFSLRRPGAGPEARRA